VIDEVRLTYAALAQAPLQDSTDLKVRVLEGSRGRIWLGLDLAGEEHLLVDSPTAPERRSGIASISTKHRELSVGGGKAHRYLDISCLEAELVEVFDHFVAAIAEASAAGDTDLGAVVATVLDRWRSFFTAAGAPPGRDAIAGILGELLLLRDLALCDATDVLATWVGPRQGRHDFRRRNTAVEVKTTLAHTSMAVTIHGEDQLLEPEAGTLHLQFVRLEEGAGLGICITDLVDELTTLGVQRLDLLELIGKSGLPPAALGSAGEIRFDVRERITVPVDQRTPRIIPASFAAGARPTGVIDLSYRIDIDRVAAGALDPAAYGELIGQLVDSGRQ
jgi:hypothetical protein